MRALLGDVMLNIQINANIGNNVIFQCYEHERYETAGALKACVCIKKMPAPIRATQTQDASQIEAQAHHHTSIDRSEHGNFQFSITIKIANF